LFIYVLLVAFLFVRVLGADVIGDSAPPKTKKKKRRGGPDEAKSAEVPALEAMGGAH
jgi:multiple sugar transport system permease protein